MCSSGFANQLQLLNQSGKEGINSCLVLRMSKVKIKIILIRDWSLITGRGGGCKMGKSRVRNFLHPPPQDRVKLFVPPLFKSENFSCPPPLQYG